MERCARLFAIAAATAALTACAGSPDSTTEQETDTGAEADALTTVAFGVDTNGTTLDIGHARAAGMGFVVRYVSFDGSHPALAPDEAARFRGAGMPLVFCWENGQQRAWERSSLRAERALGAADARDAKSHLDAIGAAGKPVYFTVDYDVTDAVWSARMRDGATGNVVTRGDFIRAYFDGIRSVLGVHRTGAYGTYTTLHELFDAGAITYGWQQTFGGRGDHFDHRAQMRQFAIGVDATGWGVGGPGALDLDRAVKPDFGQW